MSEAEIGASGVDSEASSGADASNDMVSFESYQKLLKQKKAADARIAQNEREAAEKAEQELVAQNKYKELYEQSDSKLKSLTNSFVRAEKVAAIENTVGGKLKKDAFATHLDLDSIIMNENMEIDSDSLNTVIGNHINEYGDILFDIQSAKTLPGASPSEAASKSTKELTVDEIKAQLKALGK